MPAALSRFFALDLPKRFGRHLRETCKFIDGRVVLIPADIFAAIPGPRGVDRARTSFAEELAGLVAVLDALLAGPRHLDDVLLLELAHGETEMLAAAANIRGPHLHIAGHLAAMSGTARAIERLSFV